MPSEGVDQVIERGDFTKHTHRLDNRFTGGYTWVEAGCRREERRQAEETRRKDLTAGSNSSSTSLMDHHICIEMCHSKLLNTILL